MELLRHLGPLVAMRSGRSGKRLPAGAGVFTWCWPLPQMLDFLLRLQASGEVPALFADEFDDLLERAQGNKP